MDWPNTFLSLLRLFALLALGLPACLAQAAAPFWAVQPLAPVEFPITKDRTWPIHPIDHFILARLERNSIVPSASADRTTLIRRATFDLHGLPPTPAEIDSFVADSSPDAFARVIERLLASPRYGEHWGRHWLDLAHFAESDGFEYDKMREHAWPYRDYVIHSFNADVPYGQFLQEQVAGDVIEPRTRTAMAATGFLIAGPYDEAGNSSKSDLLRARIREEELEDVIAGVSQTFLGLTMNCARCHDHKFDPIPQRDYYRLKAVFDGLGRGNRPWVSAEEARRRDKVIDAAKNEIAGIKTRLSALETEGRRSLQLDKSRTPKGSDDARDPKAKEAPDNIPLAAIVAALTDEQRAGRERLQRELKRSEQSLADLSAGPLVYTHVSRRPGPTYVLARGDVERKEAVVTAGGLSAVTTVSPDFGLGTDSDEGARRLKWTEWAIDPRNPLPARVIVNRIWQYHFGRGLVATPNDFGENGSKPTHPELLDYLAADFLRHGGSMKYLHQEIMRSRAYQQAPRVPAGANSIPQRGEELDADNRWLWHFPLRRLEAEAIRDSMLRVSDELNEQMFGPSFRPFTVTVSGSHFYHLEDRAGGPYNRRTIYRMNVQSAKEPMLDALDCPDPATRTPVRSVTTTPIQALGLMNSSFVQRQADKLANRLRRETSVASDQVQVGYRLVFGRTPSSTELVDASKLIAEQGLPTFCWVLFNASEFIYVR